MQAITQTRGNRQHVLDGPPHLDTDDVIVGIDTQGAAVKGLNQRGAHIGMLAGRNQRGGLAAGNFLRKAGAAENAGLERRGHLCPDFMNHQAVGLGSMGCSRFEPLAEPGQGRTRLRQILQQAANARHGRCNHEQVLALDGGSQRACTACDFQTFGEGHARQVTAVAARSLKLGGHGCIA